MTIELKTRDAVSLAAHLAQRLPHLEVLHGIDLAAYAHDGVFRKECRKGVEYKDPYVVHPLRNALRIARWYDGYLFPEIIARVVAALLHDTVEDAPERIIEFYGNSVPDDEQRSRDVAVMLIDAAFGFDVADAVRRVSNPIGMMDYHSHLVEEVLPNENAFVVKASDLVDNAGSLKHMVPSARRIKLANKYLDPVLTMVSGVGVVSTPFPRQHIRERLVVVVNDLNSIIENGE